MRFLKLLRRPATTLLIILLIFGSLISFPAFLALMVSIWALLSINAFRRQKPMWPWLVGCVAITLIKRPGFSPEFAFFVSLFLAVAVVDWRLKPAHSSKAKSRWLAAYTLTLLTATVSLGAVRWFAASPSRQPRLDERPIACLGDSLTDYGYPQELEKLLSVPVVDFGVSGIRTDEGIKMLPTILATNPQAVVIELGGHDYNGDKKTREATKANLEILISAFREKNIEVILVEIPRGFITDPYDGLERELSRKYDLRLIDDSVIRNFVYYSPIVPPGMLLPPSMRYSEDGLHPNALGNQYFAREVSQALKDVYGESVLR